MLTSSISVAPFSLSDELVTVTASKGDGHLAALRMTPKELERKLNGTA